MLIPYEIELEVWKLGDPLRNVASLLTRDIRSLRCGNRVALIQARIGLAVMQKSHGKKAEKRE